MSMVEDRLFSLIDDRVEPIFEFWRETMGKTNGTVLDAKRVARIEWALKHYSEEQIRHAIEGCALSTFHMGANRNRKKYNDIGLILRDATHVEQFMENYETETDAADTMEEWLNE